MNKMDEIMELLTDEINGFQKSIERLEGLSKSLNEVKLKADTSNMEWHIKEHLRKQEGIQSRNQQTMNEINQKLKRARLIPKWLLILFPAALIIQSIIVGYLSFQMVRSDKNEVIIHEKEKVELVNPK